MSLDCVIAVKGGRGVKKRTDEVQDLIKGVDSLYRAVFAHVKTCPKCDPQEVLEAYLEDRKRPKFCGATSLGLIKLAEKYERTFPGRVRPETVREFKWRVGRFEYLYSNSRGLTTDEIVSGSILIYEAWSRAKSYWWAQPAVVKRDLSALRERGWPYVDVAESLLALHESGVRAPPDREELLKFATVAQVMTC